MYKRILALMIAFLLVANFPVVAFAEETEGTTAATENSTDTTGATEATNATEATTATEGNTEPATQTDTTEASGQTDPTQATDAMEATQPTDPTDSTQGTEATAPTDASEPTGGTEPTQPTNPTSPTEPTGSRIPTSLQIDTENIYEGMDKAYEDGYVPKLQNGMMYLVLPLLSNGDIHDNEIKVSLNLGSSASSPFVIANYEKTFELEKVKPKNSEEKVELFLVEFDVKLR